MGKPRGGQKERKKERYYQAAKKHGYRSRSAYKLRQIAKGHKLLLGVDRVVELCSSPGGWTQVLRELDPSLQIVAVDLDAMSPLEGVKFVQGDILEEETIEDRLYRKYVNAMENLIDDPELGLDGMKLVGDFLHKHNIRAKVIKKPASDKLKEAGKKIDTLSKSIRSTGQK